MTDNRVPNETQRSLTIREFCAIEKRLGRGPQVMRIVGNIVRISPEARREWHTRMAAFGQEEQAKLERERRVELARRAGQAAARSQKHIANRQRAGART
jgi:hypothetical protein